MTETLNSTKKTKLNSVNHLFVYVFMASIRRVPSLLPSRHIITHCQYVRRFGGGMAHLERVWEHSTLTEKDVKHFECVVDNSAGNAILSASTEDLSFYNSDWIKKYKGKSQLVLRPKTTEEVCSILSYCNDRKLPIQIQEGNTALVGGSVPVFDEIILSTSRMNFLCSNSNSIDLRLNIPEFRIEPIERSNEFN